MQGLTHSAHQSLQFKSGVASFDMPANQVLRSGSPTGGGRRGAITSHPITAHFPGVGGFVVGMLTAGSKVAVVTRHCVRALLVCTHFVWQCLACLSVSLSIVRLQREFRLVFKTMALDEMRVNELHRKFLATGSVLKSTGGGQKHVSDEHVENVRQALCHSPRKSIRRASWELQMPR
ncbi:hypothetical protein PR048_012830 [Dryococelus australis]|uniref:Uncharacterized protein n=1 Tax=Dryococelus australis TaxID=614101 RepID=A0ABQ9HQG3_9NEOP|nr:hypothetical protein PR048_012830 [Dryococelus australis]